MRKSSFTGVHQQSSTTTTISIIIPAYQRHHGSSTPPRQNKSQIIRPTEGNSVQRWRSVYVPL